METMDAATVALLARVAVGIGGRNNAFRAKDADVKDAAMALAAARKNAARDNAADRDDTIHAEFVEARDAMFRALDGMRDAFKRRHVDGAQAFHNAAAVYAVAARVPVPARAMTTRVGSAMLNYARKHWHDYATTTRDDDRIATAGFGIASANHSGVWSEPADAVQYGALHALETDGAVTIGNIFRSVKFAAIRLSRGRAFDYVVTRPTPAYDYATDDATGSQYDDADAWRAAIAAWADHKGHADKCAARVARIAERRAARAALMNDANRALFELVSGGQTVEWIAGKVGLSPETIIRNAANVGASDYAPTFLPALPEWDVWEGSDVPSLDDVVIRNAERRAVVTRHVNRSR